MSEPTPQTTDLVGLLNHSGVSRPEAVHQYDCRYWREGQNHGPCTCGARALDARIRLVMVGCGVEIRESPAQMHERESLADRSEMCIENIFREGLWWVCRACGWKTAAP